MHLYFTISFFVFISSPRDSPQFTAFVCAFAPDNRSVCQCVCLCMEQGGKIHGAEARGEKLVCGETHLYVSLRFLFPNSFWMEKWSDRTYLLLHKLLWTSATIFWETTFPERCIFLHHKPSSTWCGEKNTICSHATYLFTVEFPIKVPFCIVRTSLAVMYHPTNVHLQLPLSFFSLEENVWPNEQGKNERNNASWCLQSACMCTLLFIYFPQLYFSSWNFSG